MKPEQLDTGATTKRENSGFFESLAEYVLSNGASADADSKTLPIINALAQGDSSMN